MQGEKHLQAHFGWAAALLMLSTKVGLAFLYNPRWVWQAAKLLGFIMHLSTGSWNPYIGELSSLRIHLRSR